MRIHRAVIAVSACVLALGILAWAQSRKPGLWEMTSNMTWQQSPLPPGMQLPPGVKSPFAGGPTTSQVCLTQAQIDKYGAPTPQSRNGDCTIENVVLKDTSMSADWVCTGRMSGKGTLQSSWAEPDHAKGTVHFVGTMQMGARSTPVEFTIESTSVYKGADCGSVQPLDMK